MTLLGCRSGSKGIKAWVSGIWACVSGVAVTGAVALAVERRFAAGRGAEAGGTEEGLGGDEGGIEGPEGGGGRGRGDEEVDEERGGELGLVGADV